MKAAKIENNIVVQIILGSSEWANEKIGGNWIDINEVNVGLGYTYNEESKKFVAPQPYPSWTLENDVWKSPLPYPNDNNFYYWNEEKQNWVQLNLEFNV